MARTAQDWVRTLRGLLCALVGVMCAQAQAQIPCAYEIAHVIQAPSTCFGRPANIVGTAISPNGQDVVGYYYCVGGDERGWVFRPATGQFITLPMQPGISSLRVNDVNDAGLAVGHMGGISGDFGFVFNLNTGQYVAQVAAVVTSAGNGASLTAINANGVACGTRTISINPTRDNAFIWSAEKGVADLGVMNGPNSAALAISDSGVVVGYSGGVFFNSSDNARAFMHVNGNTQQFGPVPDGINSVAWDVNVAQQILINGRVSTTSGVVVRSFTYENGAWSELIPLDDYAYSVAADIAAIGIVAGVSRNPSQGGSGPIDRATLWVGSQPVDVLAITTIPEGVVVTGPTGLSNTGVLLCLGTHQGDSASFVLQPIPRVIGDTNCDEIINIDDLLALINSWGPCAGCAADLNGDHSVNVQDLMLVITNWTFTK